MFRSHERNEWTRDAALRLAGVALLTVVWLVGRLWMHHLHGHPANDTSLFELLLGILLFAGASGGMILVSLGHHIFDQVELSERWRSLRK
jgi:hypothetical protein